MRGTTTPLAVAGQQLIVTQSWILMISVYNIHIAHQRDVDLSYVVARRARHRGPLGRPDIGRPRGTADSIISSYDVRGVELGNGMVAGDTTQILVIQVRFYQALSRTPLSY